MTSFDRVAQLAISRPSTLPDETAIERIRDSLDHYSEIHSKLSRILIRTLQYLGKAKSAWIISQENLKEKEDLEWTDGKNILKGENRDERLAIVRSETRKDRKNVKRLEAKVERLELLKSACYVGLTTVKLKQESISRKLTLIELEERMES